MKTRLTLTALALVAAAVGGQALAQTPKARSEPPAASASAKTGHHHKGKHGHHGKKADLATPGEGKEAGKSK